MILLFSITRTFFPSLESAREVRIPLIPPPMIIASNFISFCFFIDCFNLTNISIIAQNIALKNKITIFWSKYLTKTHL